MVLGHNRVYMDPLAIRKWGRVSRDHNPKTLGLGFRSLGPSLGFSIELEVSNPKPKISLADKGGSSKRKVGSHVPTSRKTALFGFEETEGS